MTSGVRLIQGALYRVWRPLKPFGDLYPVAGTLEAVDDGMVWLSLSDGSEILVYVEELEAVPAVAQRVCDCGDPPCESCMNREYERRHGAA